MEPDTVSNEVFDSDESDYSYDESDYDYSYDDDLDLGCLRVTNNPRTTPFYKSPYELRRENMTIEDILMDKVLQILPAKTLIRFRSVSKQWDSWIKSPLFAHRQSYSFKDLSGFFAQRREDSPTFLTLNRFRYGIPRWSLYRLPDKVNITSSSNGLILCQGCNGNKPYYICNPLTENWRQIPPPSYYHGNDPAIVLAFEPSARNVGANYRLICAVPLADQPNILFEIYSSETGSWKCSETMCIELEGSSLIAGSKFHNNGIAYWLTTTNEVLAFDVEGEIHGVIPLPTDCPRGGILAAVKGELCYIGMSWRWNDDYAIVIYGGVDLCYLRYEIDFSLEESPTWTVDQMRVVDFARDDEVVFVLGRYIYSYKMSDEYLEVKRKLQDDCRLFSYVNSLVNVA